MRRLRIRLIVAVCLVAPGLALAVSGLASATPQESQDEGQVISWVIYFEPEPGMEMEFEAALKGHAGWHAQHDDPIGYGVGQVMTGSRVGQYVIVIGGRRWADFDGLNSDMEMADRQQWGSTGGKYSRQTSSVISVAMPNVSRYGEDPFAVVRVTSFKLKPGMGQQFRGAIRKFHEAFESGGAPFRYSWSSVSAGAEGPALTLVTYHDSWADFEPDDSFSLADVMGEDELRALQMEFSECIAASEANIIVVRQDLSYAPEE